MPTFRLRAITEVVKDEENRMIAARQARRADWKIHDLNAEMMAALEDSGGEYTPEVEAIEAKMGQCAQDLALLGAKTRVYARQMQDLCRAEKRRLDDTRAFFERLESAAVRWLRLAATELGNSFDAGAYRVRLQAAPPRAVLAAATLPPEVERDLNTLRLGHYTFKPDLRAIAKCLKDGQDVPGYRLEYPQERTVVVR